MIIISTLYTNNSLQSDQPKRKMTLLNANRISGDGHRHTIKALACPNTTSQYTNEIPVCSSMRLTPTPTVTAVLLDYKAKNLAAFRFKYEARKANRPE